MKLKEASEGNGNFPKGLSNWGKQDWINWAEQATDDELYAHLKTKDYPSDSKELATACHEKALDNLKKMVLGS